MKSLIAVTVVAALALPAAASAHVTVNPREAPAGAFTILNVRVPNERAHTSTVKVDLRLPDGVYFLWYRKVPGWKVKLKRQRVDPPVDLGGISVTERFPRIVWTGKRKRGGVIRPNQYEEFPLYLRIPDGNPGDQLAFPAIQTYRSGKRDAWTGGPDSDHPASRLTLTAAK